MEANNWNPNSSPIVTSYAIGQMDRAGCIINDINHPIVKGILKYLASGEYLKEDGWIGSIPTNNNYSHAPWFHYDPQVGPEVNIGLTDHLASFIIKYADSNSDIYQKAIALKARHEPDEQADIPDFSNYDPTKYEPWGLLPTNYINSPDSEYYPIYKDIVDMELDAIVDRLHNTNELAVMHDVDIEEWEAKVPRKDGKEWNDNEQIIGNYYWASSDFISQIEILKKFGRLDFQIPVRR
jgi:hypothetical protein